MHNGLRQKLACVERSLSCVAPSVLVFKPFRSFTIGRKQMRTVRVMRAQNEATRLGQMKSYTSFGTS
eukprot:870629-Amphidinium_carterae.1